MIVYDRLANPSLLEEVREARSKVVADRRVYDVQFQDDVYDRVDLTVDVDARGMLTADLAAFSTDGATIVPVSGWAGPWPIAVRWWDAAARTASRFQVLDDRGSAWLLVLEEHSWWIEARYD